MTDRFQSLRILVEDNTSHGGRLFDYFVQSVIVISLASFSIETLPDLSQATRGILRNVEIACVAIFTAEYFLRILVARKKLSFVFSFYGLIDLAAILPFYLATGLDLRAVRIFRLLRLIRAFKLVRYSEAFQLFRRAFVIAREELILFGVVALMLLYLASVGIWYFENESQPDAFSSVFRSMWWAITTLTTVSYGDVYPITDWGKIFTFFTLVLGLGIIAVPTGILASALAEARRLSVDTSRSPNTEATNESRDD
jgi:voltage-gated potassium channel